MSGRNTLSADLQAGLTVALVSVPQCMAFAMIAGLPPVTGLYAAVVMVVVGATIAYSPKLNIGPTVTISSMVFAVLATVEPNHVERWPIVAGLLAVLAGCFTIVAAIFNVGQFARFVSRSVLVGLTAGAAILIFGSQLAPALGIPNVFHSTLGKILWHTLAAISQANVAAILMTIGTLAFILLGGRLGPRFPAAFLALVISGLIAWTLNRSGLEAKLLTIGQVPARLPERILPLWDRPFQTDMIVGAAAIALVGIIQTLAITKSLAARTGETVEPKRDLLALGAANLVTGFLHGFPGAGSFARSALNDMAGARTRLSGFLAGIAIAVIVVLAAPLAQQITLPAIAGLLMATAWSMVDWREFGHILARDRHDRIVLATTVLGVFVVPIHWAVLIGLAVSIAIFLRRVSRLHILEMVAGSNHQYQERAIDAETGKSAIAMLQVEGPLFFAHAEELAETLRGILGRGPRIVILRMRRTQQIDFSVIAVLNDVVEDYIDEGGTLIVCGLTPKMRNVLSRSSLGATIDPGRLLETTREVFGSAHQAIRLAEEIIEGLPDTGRKQFRTV